MLELDAEIRKILGHPDLLAKLEDKLLGILGSDASLAAKRGVCKSISLIATERSIPVLALMLLEAQTSDMARYALERIPSPRVEEALRQALSKVTGLARIGVIDSLGDRRAAAAAPALGALLSDPDVETRQAAAWALGRIGSAEAARLLLAVVQSPEGPARRETLDASLVCAERLLEAGDRGEAAKIYAALQAEATPEPFRAAAARMRRRR